MALRKLVQRKAKGHAIETPKPMEKPSNVINLMDALRESLKTNSKVTHPTEFEREETTVENQPPYSLGQGARAASIVIEHSPAGRASRRRCPSPVFSQTAS